jgi:hypothetical protein
MLYLTLEIYMMLWFLALFKIVNYKMFQILNTYMQEQTTKEGNTNTLFIFATSIIPKTEKKRKKGQVHIR